MELRLVYHFSRTCINQHAKATVQLLSSKQVIEAYSHLDTSLALLSNRGYLSLFSNPNKMVAPKSSRGIGFETTSLRPRFYGESMAISIYVVICVLETRFKITRNEGLISEEGNIHAGLRTRIFGNEYGDYEEDAKQNFQYIETEGLFTAGNCCFCVWSSKIHTPGRNRHR